MFSAVFKVDGQEIQQPSLGGPGGSGGPDVPDGVRIVSGSSDNTIKVWDTISGLELRTLKGHTGPVGGVSFTARPS